MNKIYADNACTSFPKPKAVVDAMSYFMTDIGANINRGTYRNSYEAADKVFECRELIKDFFNAGDPRNVIFTRGITESLNVILMGLLGPNDHVITSNMEHNAVMRPLRYLESKGSKISLFDKDNILPSLESSLCKNTKAVVVSHAGNVFGNVFPLDIIGDFCQKHKLFFIVDSAQSAGILPIDMQKSHIDALTFTGHKSLFGPQGIGGFVISDKLAEMINPLILGGTGSLSHTEYMPQFLPDKFEAGTLNIPGIIGLSEGIRYINNLSLDTVYKHEMALTKQFIEGLKPLCDSSFIALHMTGEIKAPCVSVSFNTMDNSTAAAILDEEYSVMTRVGLHCAPSAHKTAGTYPNGTVRFSFGYFNTCEEIESILKALFQLSANRGNKNGF